MKLSISVLSAILLLAVPQESKAVNLRNAVEETMVEASNVGVSDVSRADLEYAFKIFELSKQTYAGPPENGIVGEYKFLADALGGNSYAQVYKKIGSNACVVAFRGTEVKSASDVANDIAGQLDTLEINGYEVGEGFAEQYNDVKDILKPKVAESKCSEVLATGHSLGGAVAAIAQLDNIASSSLTFAEPKPFKTCPPNQAAHATRYQAKLDGKPDIVPRVPVGLVHCTDVNVELIEDDDTYSYKSTDENQGMSIWVRTSAHYNTVYTRIFEHLLSQ